MTPQLPALFLFVLKSSSVPADIKIAMIRVTAETKTHSIDIAGHPDIQRSGWDQQKLRRLVQLAKAVAINFEAMTRGQAKPNFILTHQELDGNAAVEVNAETLEIYISLKAGPETVFEEVPLTLTEEMIDLLFKPRREISSQPSLSIPNPKLLLASGAKAILMYFQQIRGIRFKNEVEFVTIFILAASTSGEKVAKQRLAFNLLGSFPLPKKEIVNEMEKSLDKIRRMISAPKTDINKVSVWDIIATLASLSVVAEWVGCPEIGAKCLNVLSGETGMQLSAIDFMQLGLYSDPHCRISPCMSNYQLMMAIGGFHLAFDVFHEILEFYFDRVMVA